MGRRNGICSLQGTPAGIEIVPLKTYRPDGATMIPPLTDAVMVLVKTNSYDVNRNSYDVNRSAPIPTKLRAVWKAAVSSVALSPLALKSYILYCSAGGAARIGALELQIRTVLNRVECL